MINEPSWLDKARGYIDIGMLDEASAAIESLPEARRVTPEAKEMNIVISILKKDLDEAFTLCEEFSEEHPEHHAGFIQGAYCLHAQGRTQNAIDFLQSGPKTLLEEPVYFYNLACYEVALERSQAALTWLNQSIEMKPANRQLALKDPDLALIRSEIL
ncbi:hypothetical protein VSU19_11470 [Verrucomicrobiales bacterium BCK34]|nr:hypothetical protein [Verrucomicrobiales bacterium BCK34]